MLLTMNQVQRKFYLPQELYAQLTLTAKVQQKPIGALVRELIELGLAHLQTSTVAEREHSLLDISQKAEQEQWRGPKNLAKKHDSYFAKS